MSNDSLRFTRVSEARRFDDNKKLLSPHIEDYSREAHVSLDRILRLWNEIELPKEERQMELDAISNAVKYIWTSAVDKADKKKEEFQKEIDKAIQDIYKIKEELGESPTECQQRGIEGILKLEQIVGCSLRARYTAAQEILLTWKRQRTQREEDIKALQSQINRLKIRFGNVVIAPYLSPRNSDISLGNLQKLRDELEDCKTERLKRERELAALLSRLRSICLQLGENDIDVAAMAHPSLRFYREALPDQFSLIRPSFSNQPGLQRNIRPDEIELDLSDETFTNLDRKTADMFDLKASRERQTLEVGEILRGIWKALDVPDDDLEPLCDDRLHLQSIEKCKTEVRRLEKAKSQELWDLIDAERRELAALCEETKLPMPSLSSLLSSTNVEDESASVGNISNALTKLSRMISETQSLAEKRGPILLQINEVERSRSEVGWLVEYEKDGDRYKGRDSTKKLNRALRAGRMRDKLPDMLKTLKKAISQWEHDEHCPFVYQGQDYSVVLENLSIELTVAGQTVVRNPRRSSSRGRNQSRMACTPPPPHMLSPTPSDMHVSEDLRSGAFYSPHYPGSGSQNSTLNRKGREPVSPETFTSRLRRHHPDAGNAAEIHKLARSQNLWGPEHTAQLQSPVSLSGHPINTGSVTPNEFDTIPSIQGTPSDNVVYVNDLYRTSPMADVRMNRTHQPQQQDDIQSRSDHSYVTESRDEWPPAPFRNITDSRLTRSTYCHGGGSSHGDDFGSVSTPGETRSTGSSRRSLAMERTDGRPT